MVGEGGEVIPWSRRGALWLLGLAGVFLFSLLGTGVAVMTWVVREWWQGR